MTGVLTEAVLTFFLVTVVITVAHTAKEPEPHASLAVGLILAVSILVGGPVTGAALNPARAFGPALASGMWNNQLVYWTGPFLGALVAVFVYRRITSNPVPKG